MANEKRLIDANGVEFALIGICNRESGIPLAVAEWLANVVRNAPTVDAVEVVPGRWVWISDSVVSCSQCNRDFYSDDDVNAGITWFYCPNCGADMRGETE